MEEEKAKNSFWPITGYFDVKQSLAKCVPKLITKKSSNFFLITTIFVLFGSHVCFVLLDGGDGGRSNDVLLYCSIIGVIESCWACVTYRSCYTISANCRGLKTQRVDFRRVVLSMWTVI